MHRITLINRRINALNINLTTTRRSGSGSYDEEPMTIVVADSALLRASNTKLYYDVNT